MDAHKGNFGNINGGTKSSTDIRTPVYEGVKLESCGKIRLNQPLVHYE